jgi:myo-inositol-1(or 4)-monophosphatase
MNVRDYLHTAIRAAQAAARIQRYNLGGELDISTKSSDTDLVTRVDKECEARIREILLGAYPEHVVLGEEQGQPGGAATCRWVVDPLDGTLNYAHGFPFYCVSIALEVDGVLQVGVVLDPVRSELFTAVRGGGAYLNGAPIHVSKEAELIRSLLATGFAYVQDAASENIANFTRVMPHVLSIRRPGAAALDLSYVACGRLEGFWELKLNPWDVAAAVLLIREAGGVVTGARDQPYELGERTLVASNGHIHEGLLGILELDTVGSQ